MKHTLGPWSTNNSPYDQRRESQRIDGPDGLPVATILQLAAHRADKLAAFYEAHANGKVIAAAPDLLAALLAALPILEAFERNAMAPIPQLAQARAAIAKAITV